MAVLNLGVRVYGIENAQGRMTRFRKNTREKIRATIDQERSTAVNHMREDFMAEHPWGYGQTAASLRANISETDEGFQATISVGNLKQVKYLTTLVSDSEYHPDEYPIIARKRALVFYWKRKDTRFWGPVVIHPGFPRDTLRESGQEAVARMGYMVERAVRTAVAEDFSD